MKFTLIALGAFIVSEVALTADEDFWYFQTSFYTNHWHHDPAHNNHQELLGIEHYKADESLWGVATFLNSFHQRSYYAYYGQRWSSESYPIFIKLSGGLIKGYKGDYENKIPLNQFGIAPALIPSIGVLYGDLGAELIVLGASATMINIGFRY